VDLFNVLNGLNSDWGRYMGVFTASTNLLRAERFDVVCTQHVAARNHQLARWWDPAAAPAHVRRS
jgi:hypothetical protein